MMPISRSLDGAFWRMSRRHATVRRVRRIAATAASEEEKLALTSILLVEGGARPTPVRSLEWIALTILRSGLAGAGGARRARRLTLGPLQLRGAPLEWDECVRLGLKCLHETDCADLAAVALKWNGRAAPRAGRIPYDVALSLAAPHAARLLDRCRAAGTDCERFPNRRRLNVPPNSASPALRSVVGSALRPIVSHGEVDLSRRRSNRRPLDPGTGA